MAEAALLNNLDQRAQILVDKVSGLPASFWRTLVIAVAVIWACHSLAQLVWIILSPPKVEPPKTFAVQAVAGEQSAPSYTVDLASLQAVKIFGDGVEPAPEEVAAAAAAQVQEDVEKTKLNLKLVGLMASMPQENSSAVIANGSNQNIYQINDKLPAGKNVSLAKVLHDRVILDNNGNYEALWLYTEADFKVNFASSPAPVEEESNDEPAEIKTKIRPSQIPKNLSEVVRFSVHREEGQMVGFRIRPGKKRELFEQMGLKANDVVTSVNGIAIDSPQAIRENYQQLKTATSADLEVKRGEETLYINVSIDTAVSE